MSGHRAIAPSTDRPESHSSSGKASESAEQSSLSQNTSATSSGSAGFQGAAGVMRGESQRRRRTPANVSTMACTECRQARQKCDGDRQNACSRCTKRKLSCVYQPHVKTHKGDLLREIESLHKDKSKLEDENKDILEAQAGLQSQNRDLQEWTESSNLILETISKNGHDKDIIARLRAGDSYQEIADWLVEQVQSENLIDDPPQFRRSLLNVVKRYESEYQDEDGLRRAQTVESDEPRILWTNVSSSHSLIGHLFDLYFTWVHPVHMLFSELDFKYSFRTTSGNNCSIALVNAICAMACHLLENQGARKSKDPARGRDLPIGSAHEARTLRDGFMTEARKALTQENHKEMASVQAFAVMYLVDSSACKARHALGYLRASVENLSSAVKNQSLEAQQITTWGIHSLNTACVGITYQKFYTPELPGVDSYEGVQMDRDGDIWRFYRTVGDELEMPHRPGHAILTACYQAKLFRIVRNSLNLYCGYAGKVTAHKVIACYKQYTDWKTELPDVLQNVDEGAQPLPYTLYLHVLYHTAILQHLTPLLECNYFRPPDQDELRRMMTYHARRGLELLEHSRRLYTTRYHTPLLSFCTIHLGDTVIRHSPHNPPASEVAVFCLETLSETSAGFAICGPLSALFRQTLTECGIPLPDDLDDRVGKPVEYT